MNNSSGYLYSILFQRGGLSELSVGKELTWPLVLRWAREIAAAIAHLHAQRVSPRRDSNRAVVSGGAQRFGGGEATMAS